jgi:hypothetical protein
MRRAVGRRRVGEQLQRVVQRLEDLHHEPAPSCERHVDGHPAAAVLGVQLEVGLELHPARQTQPGAELLHTSRSVGHHVAELEGVAEDHVGVVHRAHVTWRRLRTTAISTGS